MHEKRQQECEDKLGTSKHTRREANTYYRRGPRQRTKETKL